MEPGRQTKITFHLQNHDASSAMQLTYEAHTHSVAEKWLQFFKSSVEDKESVIENGSFMGAAFFSEAELIESLRDVIKTINGHGHDHISINPQIGISQQSLNELHGLFEQMDLAPHYNESGIPGEVRKSITDLNILIHKVEQIRSGITGGMIEVNFKNVKKAPLDRQELQLFTPDIIFGDMYLTYGQTGVPVLNAFYSDVCGQVTPQNTYTGGVWLSFYPTHKFDMWEELENWIIKNKVAGEISEELAIGHIPLAKLITEFSNPTELLEKLSRHQRIAEIVVL